MKGVNEKKKQEAKDSPEKISKKIANNSIPNQNQRKACFEEKLELQEKKGKMGDSERKENSIYIHIQFS
jgi:hypothetical protein